MVPLLSKVVFLCCFKELWAPNFRGISRVAPFYFKEMSKVVFHCCFKTFMAPQFWRDFNNSTPILGRFHKLVPVCQQWYSIVVSKEFWVPCLKEISKVVPRMSKVAFHYCFKRVGGAQFHGDFKSGPLV